MSLEPAPKRGDVVYLADGESFTYVERQCGADGEAWAIEDPSGEDFLVVRAVERDALLRMAVHDDGRRRAWRVLVHA